MSTQRYQRYSLLLVVAAAVVALPFAVPASAPCPEGMARVNESFCVDRYEASLVEVGQNGAEHAWSPYHSPERVHVRAVSRRNVVPQGYISATQAERACQAAGKRLCSNREWTTACTGPSRTTRTTGGTRWCSCSATRIGTSGTAFT
jgi:sulfatase modifying factor 1